MFRLRSFSTGALVALAACAPASAAHAFCGFFVAGSNNFQGRYIVRHYWQGQVACKDPRYDQWGGPPGDPYGNAVPTAAKRLATAPRGKIALAKEVQSPVPLLGIPGKAPPRRRAK